MEAAISVCNKIGNPSCSGSSIDWIEPNWTSPEGTLFYFIGSEKLPRDPQNNETKIAATVRGTAAFCISPGCRDCHQPQNIIVPENTRRWYSITPMNETAYWACKPHANSKSSTLSSKALFLLGIRSIAWRRQGGEIQSWNTASAQFGLQDLRASWNSWGLIGGSSASGGRGSILVKDVCR